MGNVAIEGKGRSVVVDNRLIGSSYTLTITEKRLLWSLISKVKPRLVFENNTIEGEVLDSRKEYILSVNEFAGMWEQQSCNARTDLLLAVDTLFNRYIFLESTGKWEKFRWIQSISFDKEKDEISLRWSESIIPFISQLYSHFSKLPINAAMNIGSSYTWKLYDILYSSVNFKLRGFQAFDMKNLQFALAVPESCKDFKYFNSKILKPSVEEINRLKLFDKEVVLTEVRVGRKVGIIECRLKKREGIKVESRVDFKTIVERA